jgi:hypothetical protein
VQRAELLMTIPGMARRLAQAALRDQRGTAFLMGLMIVMVMTLLGVALFEMSTIEAVLARSDALDIQAFYCAEAEAARVYACYGRAKNPADELACESPGETSLTLANGTYVSSVEVDTTGGVTVTATCKLPTGRTRTVQRNGKRANPDPILRFAEAGAGANPVTGAQDVFGDVVLGGADSISGDIYVSGNVHLRGEGTVTGYGTPDPPAITVAPGKAVTISPPFDAAATGLWAQAPSTPLPVLSNGQGEGIIDKIRLAVTNKDGTPMMTGTYQNATVYNLGEIFAQLGVTNEGNRERNLARPGGCTFGVVSPDVKCQIWQDLVILGPRQTCPTSPCPPGFVGPTDKPSYFFMGLPRSPSTAPQGTSFADIYAAAVTSSAELQQLGFTTQYSSLGSQLDAILGANPNGEGRIDRLVDLTVGIHPSTAKGMPRDPSIFYVDGYWRSDDSASGFAYNGRGTIVASKSVILSDSLLYLGNMSNVNADAPKGACSATDRGLCGAADMLGIIAQENIWIGDPNGQIHEVDAVMLAGRDINLVQYAASAATCCDGVTNELTFKGSVLALRGTALARDWADPTPGHQDADCNAAQPPCRPVTFVQADTSCGGGAGCWRYLSKDPVSGLFAVDTALSGFPDCVTTQTQPLCLSGSRRVTHFKLTINYDKRLQEYRELIPPGLPTRGLAALLWRDCGSDPKCR